MTDLYFCVNNILLMGCRRCLLLRQCKKPESKEGWSALNCVHTFALLIVTGAQQYRRQKFPIIHHPRPLYVSVTSRDKQQTHVYCLLFIHTIKIYNKLKYFSYTRFSQITVIAPKVSRWHARDLIILRRFIRA